MTAARAGLARVGPLVAIGVLALVMLVWAPSSLSAFRLGNLGKYCAWATAGIGIGLVWSAGLQGISRQPEMASKIQTSMFIGAALVEGIALFALVICFLQMS